jgi:hypothetical protein
MVNKRKFRQNCVTTSTYRENHSRADRIVHIPLEETGFNLGAGQHIASALSKVLAFF